MARFLRAVRPQEAGTKFQKPHERWPSLQNADLEGMGSGFDLILPGTTLGRVVVNQNPI